MYFTSVPNHNDPAFNEDLHFSKFGKHNIVFRAASNTSYCERHVGCLSIKTVLSGMEWYGVNHQQLAVRPGQFLVLNDDQEYSCRVDRNSKTAILSIFFSNEFASSVLYHAVNSEETLLDNFNESPKKIPEFFQTLASIEAPLQQKLLNLVITLEEDGYQCDVVNEHLVFLLNDILLAHHKNVQQANDVLSVKPGTRMEIYKRLCFAKDFMHATFMKNPDLSSISSAACLSIPQLVRQFKAVFQTTPHQYLTRIRISHAAQMLKHSHTPISEVALASGFEDTSAFCRAFKREYHLQPVRFRERKK
jgi:AraC family transcriptional regulator